MTGWAHPIADPDRDDRDARDQRDELAGGPVTPGLQPAPTFSDLRPQPQSDHPTRADAGERASSPAQLQSLALTVGGIDSALEAAKASLDVALTCLRHEPGSWAIPVRLRTNYALRDTESALRDVQRELQGIPHRSEADRLRDLASRFERAAVAALDQAEQDEAA